MYQHLQKKKTKANFRLKCGKEQGTNVPPPSPPAAAAEAAHHRSRGGAAARVASSVEASCGRAAGDAPAAPWSVIEPRASASGRVGPIRPLVTWLGEISFSNLGGAGDPALTADGFGPRHRFLFWRSRFAGRLGGFGSGAHHNVVGELFDGVRQGRIPLLSGVDRVRSPQFQGVVNVHVRPGHPQAGSGLKIWTLDSFRRAIMSSSHCQMLARARLMFPAKSSLFLFVQWDGSLQQL